jgi:hypothetical protein
MLIYTKQLLFEPFIRTKMNKKVEPRAKYTGSYKKTHDREEMDGSKTVEMVPLPVLIFVVSHN